MVIGQSVFPENGHFNLKLYIWTSVCRIFLNKIQNGVSVFSKFFLNLFLLHLKVQLGLKSRKKLHFELFFDITAGFFKIWDTVLLPPFCSLKQTLHPVFVVDGCRVIRRVLKSDYEEFFESKTEWVTQNYNSVWQITRTRLFFAANPFPVDFRTHVSNVLQLQWYTC